MSGIRSVRVALPPPVELVPVAVPMELAEHAERDLPEVLTALHQAASAFRSIGMMIGDAPNGEVAALAELCGRGLLHLAEGEGERLDDLAVCIRQGLAFGKPHPDDPKPSTPEMET